MATYLVTQASGKQAQWTITHLLAAGAKVNAVVRNPDNAPAILKKPGVTIFKGESVNFQDISLAAQGCKGVFLNTFPIPGLEAQQAQTIVDASKEAGIESIVATTTVLTGDKSMWDDDATKEVGLFDYYSSKSAVEGIVRGAGFKAYTILRPGFIHFDYLAPNFAQNYPTLSSHGELLHSFNDGAGMLHTDANDVGKYAASALLDPAKFSGQEIELVKENLTVEEVRDILIKVSGRQVRVKKRTPAEAEEAKASVFGSRFQLLANIRDFSGVIAAAKGLQEKYGIPFTSLETALQREKAGLLECLPV